MANAYDAVVIGGGHNGLISGGLFAKAGARTVVLEARDKTGGAADTADNYEGVFLPVDGIEDFIVRKRLYQERIAQRMEAFA